MSATPTKTAGTTGAPAKGTPASRFATADSPSPSPAMINRLRSDLRAKSTTIEDLKKEIRTLQNMMEAKDTAIESAEAAKTAAEERALESDGAAASLRRASSKWEKERATLIAERDAANAEADRLNQQLVSGAGGSGSGGSLDDVVRLHNQLAEARKEIKRLKEDNKGAYSQLHAKDAALDELQSEVTVLKDVADGRYDDRNAILDLKRQLREAQTALGSSDQLGQVIENEAEQAKAALESHMQQVTDLQRAADEAKAEAITAQAEAAAAESAAAQARAEAAEAKAEAEQTKSAAAQRLREAEALEGEAQHAISEAVGLRVQLEAAEKDANAARTYQERLLNSLDAAVSAALRDPDSADGAALLATLGGTTAAELLQSQLRELKAKIDVQHKENAEVLRGKASASAKAAKERLALQKMKARLAEVLGEDQYIAEFGEVPPTDDGIAALESEASVMEQAQAAAISTEIANAVGAVAAERDTALAEAREAQEEIRRTKEQAERAYVQAREEAQASSAARVAAIEMTLASKQRDVEQLSTEIETVRREVAEKVQQLVEAQQVAEQQKVEISEATAKARELQQHVEEMQERVTTATAAAAANAAAVSEREHNVEQLAEVTEARDNAVSQVASLEEALKDKDKQLEVMSDRLQEMATRAAMLQEREEASTEFMDALQMAAAGKQGVDSDFAMAWLGGGADIDEFSGYAAMAMASGEEDEEEDSADEEDKKVEQAVGGGDGVVVEEDHKEGGDNDDTHSDTNTPPEAMLPLSPIGGDDDVTLTTTPAAVLADDEQSIDIQNLNRDELLHELTASRVEVAVLKQRLDELEGDIAVAQAATTGKSPYTAADAAHGSSKGEEEEDYDDYREDYREDDDDDVYDGQSSPDMHLHRHRPATFESRNAVEGAGMTSAALAGVLDTLLAARNAQQQQQSTGVENGGGGDDDDVDDDLYKQAIEMLQTELSRLGLELAENADAAERLRGEVGALQTAELTAEATAALLEENNALLMKNHALSIKVAAQKIALGERENEYARCEESLLREIAALKSEKRGLLRGGGGGSGGKSSSKLKSMKRAVSSAAKGLQKSLDSAVQGRKHGGGSGDGGNRGGTSPFAGLAKRFGGGGDTAGGGSGGTAAAAAGTISSGPKLPNPLERGVSNLKI